MTLSKPSTNSFVATTSTPSSQPHVATPTSTVTNSTLPPPVNGINQNPKETKGTDGTPLELKDSIAFVKITGQQPPKNLPRTEIKDHPDGVTTNWDQDFKGNIDLITDVIKAFVIPSEPSEQKDLIHAIDAFKTNSSKLQTSPHLSMRWALDKIQI